jgi:hypothetical protein
MTRRLFMSTHADIEMKHMYVGTYLLTILLEVEYYDWAESPT